MDIYKAYVYKIIANGGDVVMNDLIATKAPRSVMSYASQIRNAAFDMPITLRPAYTDAINILKNTETDGLTKIRINAFVDMSRKEQHVELRKTKYKPFNSPLLDQLAASIPLLPVEFDSFTIPDSLLNSVIDSNTKAKCNKNHNIITIKNYQQYIDAAITVLVNYNLGVKTSNYDVINSLLLLSGRRCAEIASGQSSFTPTDDPYVVHFDGQLKTDSPESYKIHLLCHSSVFVPAYKRLIDKIGVIEPNAASKKYDGHCNTKLREKTKLDIKCHTLRSLYMSAVFNAFGYNKTMAYSYFIQQAAGHSSPTTSLHYTAANAEGVNYIANRRIPVPQIPS